MKANLVLLLISVLRGSTFMPDLTGPSMAYLKSTVTFECTMSVSTSPPIFDLIKDDGKILATRDDPQEDQPIRFYLKVSMESEGVYFCRVTSRGQKSMSNPVHLQVVIPVQGTYIVPDPDPPVLYERAGLILRCEVKKGTHLDYDWYHNKQEVTSPSSLYHLAENTMRVDSASERHAGTYSCVAKNRMKNNTRYSSSMPVTVHVKSKCCLYEEKVLLNPDPKLKHL
ncbi:B-cell receptor CD22 [Trichomycterus rosablanca]|uniref:B-cell receptor CD22 n=1 Tax=Trichomycterus rosablanca TaxID=2290929 RepID=UPI002F35B1D0